MKISIIKKWLIESEPLFKKSIEISKCSKWKNSLISSQIHIIECGCISRENECAFIELYYKLHEIVIIHHKQTFFKEELKKYELILNDEKAVMKWVDQNEWVGSRLLLNINRKGDIYLIINNSNDFNEVTIDKKDFQYALKYHQLFDSLYYSSTTVVKKVRKEIKILKNNPSSINKDKLIVKLREGKLMLLLESLRLTNRIK
ncbi:hypothetical protein UJ101_02030 [Flavobacteriaceae bacterium UJ101]|nr:hypothetical protein UJ101_02030 [Flavobacteriaceae bacterium UJ101]